MALFTAEDLIKLLKNMGKDLGYEIDKDFDFDIENTVTISFFGKEKKLLLSVVVLYGGIVNKINIFDKNDTKILEESIKANHFDKNEYQNIINKVQEELNKNLEYVPKINKLYKLKEVFNSDIEQEINRMATEGWELHSSTVSEFSYDREYNEITADKYTLIFRKQK